MPHREAELELATHLCPLFIQCPFDQATENRPFPDIRVPRNPEFKSGRENSPAPAMLC